MPLIDTKSGRRLSFTIEPVQSSDYKWIANSPEFSFDWDEEKQHEVHKIHLLDEQEEILGLDVSY